MTFGSLFAGIGGFDLGFERAGMRCVWQVELDPYCRRVLAKHWPDVPRWDDVRTFTGEGFERADVICGGFPCQDISNAGKRAGIDGDRSGLWTEFARVVRVLRSRYVVVENVAALLTRGMGTVLGDLVAIGYCAEWECIPAAAVGAPHIRDRVFILADANKSFACEERQQRGRKQLRTRCNSRPSITRDVAHAADPDRRTNSCLAQAGGKNQRQQPRRTSCREIAASDWWETESSVDRVADGIPDRLDRLRALGNAVVPQVAHYIGRRLMELTPCT